MKSVEHKTWNVFTFQILEKIISIVEDRTLKIYFCPELGVSNEKCGGQNLRYFQISNFCPMRALQSVQARNRRALRYVGRLGM